jgi:hypothetical protein
VRRAAKRDESEPGIIQAFLAGGASVRPYSGTGAPDLVVGYRGMTHLVENKTGRGKLTEAQEAWQRGWTGEPVAIARTPKQAQSLLRQWEAAQAVWDARLHQENDRQGPIQPRTAPIGPNGIR